MEYDANEIAECTHYCRDDDEGVVVLLFVEADYPQREEDQVLDECQDQE